ncbi:MAG: calcium/sodium antiporter [Phycisphaerales bacterium]|nr:calcium/sodium antiporter [Phycisphaerales bacterium]
MNIDPQNLPALLLMALLVSGAGAMILGAHLLVISAIRIARRAGLSPFFIGVTIVAFGTSVPELASSLYAVFNDMGPIALGNVIGSNIANLALVLGIVAMIKPIPVRAPHLKSDLILVILVGLTPFLAIFSDDVLGRGHGILLIALLAIFMWRSRAHNTNDQFEDIEIEGRWPLWWIAAALIAGPALLWAGSASFILSAEGIGGKLGIGEAIVGLTIVAFTTSLPELIISIYAIIRGYEEVGIGNLLGSCIMNVLGVLGVVLLVGPNTGITVDDHIYSIDVPALLIVSVVCVPILLSGRKVTRPEGALLFILYVAYIAILLTLGRNMADKTGFS